MTGITRSRNLALILMMVAGCAVPSFAADESTIAQLENKFFMHDYAKNNLEDRLSRLERMVYGQVREGSADVRLSRLAASVALASGSAKPSTTIAQKSAPASPVATPPAAKPAEETISEAAPTAASSNYPAIAAIEKKILGKTYISDPAVKRLDRLEKIVFGQANDGLLVDRVDRLKKKTGIDIAMQDPNARQWADEDDTTDETANSEPEPVPVKPFASSSRASAPPSRTSDSSYRAPAQKSRQLAEAPSTIWEATSKPVTPKKPSPTVSYPKAAPSLIAQANVPPPAPPSVVDYTSGPEAAPSLGVVRQLSRLEYQMFGRVYGDALTLRLARLESAVFPLQPAPRAQPLGARIARLLRAVQASAPVPLAQGRMHRPVVPQNPPLFNVP
jgi:hypothetical protein